MAFKYFHADKHGYLTVCELKLVRADLGDDILQEAEVHAFLQIADKDKKNKLDIAKLKTALEQNQHLIEGKSYVYLSP